MTHKPHDPSRYAAGAGAGRSFPRSFAPVVRHDFPRLAWLFDLTGGPTAHHGADVELFGSGLVEGCWDGPFAEFAFLGCPNLFGSGVVAADGATWFCPPCHTVDCLYAMAHRGRLLVSNSLLILFRESGAPLVAGHRYTGRLATVVDGIDAAETTIYRSAETALHRVVYDDFTFEGGVIGRRRKRAPDGFADFAAYRRYLLDTLRACAGNADDPRRRRRYRLLATCSSGYDSNAGAALAAQVGGRRAISLRSGRGGGDDSGRPVAERLGLACVERERCSRPSGDVGAEIEFLMTGSGGADYPLATFADELAGSLCLTGYHAEAAWDARATPSGRLARTGNTGCSLAEFRLRIGFLHLPVPAIGARRDADIVAIGRSPEMAPFSVGGGYDRPIPRRLVEEAGVPRHLFGREKQAVALVFSWGPMFLSPPVRAAFLRFLRRRGLLGPVLADHLGFTAAHLAFRLLRKAARRSALLDGLGRRPRRWLEGRFRSYENTAFANALFVWALGEAIAGGGWAAADGRRHLGRRQRAAGVTAPPGRPRP